MNTPVPRDIVNNKIKLSEIEDIGKASIRQLVKIVSEIEADTGIKYVRMEMGIPGLKPPDIAINAEIEALQQGLASIYPQMDGIPQMKKEAARFAKLFLNIDISPAGCITSSGSMQGAMASFMVAGRRYKNKDTVLFIDPGFPVQKQQVKSIGMKYKTFDVYNYRGKKLREKLLSYAKEGNLSVIIYSNPNNPSWICLTDEELSIIGEIANTYDIIIVEDLAYFAMDFRQDLSSPGEPPFQPTVAHYTDKYVLLVSCSKSLSYAGQRVGIMMVPDGLYQQKFPDLQRFFPTIKFGDCVIYGALYCLSAGTSHTAQHGVAAVLKAINDGTYNFVEDIRTYGKRATTMKKLFTMHGFKIVYDMDVDQPIADGFYFTLSYPGYTGNELVREMLYYGISAISLDITGSERTEGVRACVSHVSEDQFDDLEKRLIAFHKNHQ